MQIYYFQIIPLSVIYIYVSCICIYLSIYVLLTIANTFHIYSQTTQHIFIYIIYIPKIYTNPKYGLSYSVFLFSTTSHLNRGNFLRHFTVQNRYLYACSPTLHSFKQVQAYLLFQKRVLYKMFTFTNTLALATRNNIFVIIIYE